METKFHSSFIPKSPVIGGPAKKEPMNILGVLGSAVFILVLLGTGGLFVYKKILEKSISGLQAELAVLESGVDKGAIEGLLVFDRKLKTSVELVQKHTAVSKLFQMIEDNTVSAITFLGFKYNTSAAGTVSVEMNGLAPNYAAIALQEDLFNKNEHVVSTEFENMTKAKNGTTFVFKGVFNKSVLNFATPPTSAEPAATSSASVGDEVLTSELDVIEADLNKTEGI